MLISEPVFAPNLCKHPFLSFNREFHFSFANPSHNDNELYFCNKSFMNSLKFAWIWHLIRVYYNSLFLDEHTTTTFIPNPPSTKKVCLKCQINSSNKKFDPKLLLYFKGSICECCSSNPFPHSNQTQIGHAIPSNHLEYLYFLERERN